MVCHQTKAEGGIRPFLTLNNSTVSIKLQKLCHFVAWKDVLNDATRKKGRDR